MKTVCLRSSDINRIVVPFGNEVCACACVAICLLKILSLNWADGREKKKLIGTCNVYDPFVRSFHLAHRFKCLRWRYSISFLIRCFSLRNTLFSTSYYVAGFFFKSSSTSQITSMKMRLNCVYAQDILMRQRNDMLVHSTSFHSASPFCFRFIFPLFSPRRIGVCQIKQMQPLCESYFLIPAACRQCKYSIEIFLFMLCTTQRNENMKIDNS